MSQVGKTALKGHGLLYEGKPYNIDGYRIQHAGGPGRGKCSCGALSEELTSDNQRKSWHRDHKELVRQQMESGQ